MMPASATNPFSFNTAIAGQLACPVCHGDLRAEAVGLDEMRLVCAGCGRAYPIVEGIPVLIAERATRPR
jgi:uncharacterized protein YbaR (Trm112 family)